MPNKPSLKPCVGCRRKVRSRGKKPVCRACYLGVASMSVLEIETEIGVERLCRGCGEYWPVDDVPVGWTGYTDFWYMVNGKVTGRCRACWAERMTLPDGRRVFRPMTVAV